MNFQTDLELKRPDKPPHRYSPKPPLGAKPTEYICYEQIQELAQAIDRYAENYGKANNISKIKGWANEIIQLANLINNIK